MDDTNVLLNLSKVILANLFFILNLGELIMDENRSDILLNKDETIIEMDVHTVVKSKKVYAVWLKKNGVRTA